jgi:hypothetical protein
VKTPKSPGKRLPGTERQMILFSLPLLLFESVVNRFEIFEILNETNGLGTVVFHREEAKGAKKAKKAYCLAFLRLLRSLRFFAVKKYPNVAWFDLVKSLRKLSQDWNSL